MVSRYHLSMCLITLTYSRLSISKLKLLSCDLSWRTAIYRRGVQHDGPAIQDELLHVTVYIIHENLKTKKAGETVACNVLDEFSDEILPHP